jgi:hypothetical protein
VRFAETLAEFRKRIENERFGTNAGAESETLKEAGRILREGGYDREP